MRKYDVENYIRYEKDLKVTLGSKLYERDDYENLSRDQIIIKFLPLVINLARKFSTAQVASGVLQFPDLIQYGNMGLTELYEEVLIVIEEVCVYLNIN